jgi:hypothetical protein
LKREVSCATSDGDADVFVVDEEKQRPRAPSAPALRAAAFCACVKTLRANGGAYAASISAVPSLIDDYDHFERLHRSRLLLERVEARAQRIAPVVGWHDHTQLRRLLSAVVFSIS